MKTTAAQSRLPLILITFLLIISLVASALRYPGFIFSATANHIVISEVQVSGGEVDDEFVELYNPTSSDVSLSGWRLNRKTSSGTESILVADLTATIPSHGFFLITPPAGYDGVVDADITYSNTTNRIADNNTILLYSDAGSTLVDKVGMGTAVDNETATFGNPGDDSSIERKPGEAVPNGGNGEDNNDNLSDFSFRDISDPQNTESSPEIPVTPPIIPSSSPTMTPTEPPSPTVTPTEGPTPTLTPSPEPSPTESVTPTLTPSPEPSPTEIPSPSVTPTEEPTMTPSPSPEPSATLTPTVEPTNVPTEIPTPTLLPTLTITPTTEPSVTAVPTTSPSPMPTPTLTPTPTPQGLVIGLFNFPGSRTVCRMTFTRINVMWTFFVFPNITCTKS